MLVVHTAGWGMCVCVCVRRSEERDRFRELIYKTMFTNLWLSTFCILYCGLPVVLLILTLSVH